MSLTSIHYNQRSKCIDRTAESVYTTIRLAHPHTHCWNAVHIRNKWCCNCGRM